MKPTERQILGAKIRAASEDFERAHRKPYRGGFEIPNREQRLRHLSGLFEIPPHEISIFLTWSRTCTHPWSSGACEKCP